VYEKNGINQKKSINKEEILMQKHYNLSKKLLIAHIEGMTEQERKMALEGFRKATEELLKEN
jgi:hypothetical protein